MDIPQLVIAGMAAILAGIVNAIAGGGTLITFPILTAIGLSPVVANITSTVALCPGYLSGTLAQRKDLQGQKRKLIIFLPLAVVGGAIGGIILLYTGDKNFRIIVPWLILLASILLAIQKKIKNLVSDRSKSLSTASMLKLPVIILLFLAAIYGGYFGAGVSVIVLASLGLIFSDSIIKLNALKQAIAFAINISAAIYFSFSGRLNWPIALVMAVGAIIGGTLGGRLSSKISPILLRTLVVIIGLTVALYYFIF